MKIKRLMALSLLIGLHLIGISQTQPNGGFEDWTTDTLSHDPDHWGTFSLGVYMNQGTSLSAYPVFNSATGDTALHLENVATPNGPAIGLAMSDGYAFSGGIGGGFPFTEVPDSITGYIRYQMQPGDTAFLIVALKMGGAVQSQMVQIFPDTQSTWTEFGFPIPAPAGTIDSVLVVATSGHFDHPVPGSWLEIDSLRFTNTTGQIPNGDFVNWSITTIEDPAEWSTVNGWAVLDGTPSATAGSPAYAGNYALRLETVQVSAIGGPAGYITNGYFGNDGPAGGAAMSGVATSLSFWYQYFPSGLDTAIGMVTLTKWNGISRDTVFSQSFLIPPVGTWTEFTLPITPSGACDTFSLAFASGNFPAGAVPIGSVLWVDEVTLPGFVGTQAPQGAGPKWVVFPNPCSDWVEVVGAKVEKVTLFDIQGRRILVGQGIGEGNAKISVSEVPEGNYFMVIEGNGKKEAVRVWIKR